LCVIVTTGDWNCNKRCYQPERCLKWVNLYNYWAEPSKDQPTLYNIKLKSWTIHRRKKE
jgi:hypothetical protein